jgi:TldD protein
MDEGGLLSQVDVARVLKRALSRGGEFADLFAEEKLSTLIELEAERVERLVQGRRAGAGVPGGPLKSTHEKR